MKRLVIILALLILVAAVANLMLAIRATNADPLQALGGRVQVLPAPGDWPSPTPVPWPHPNQRMVAEVFAARSTDVRTVESGQTTHSMEHEEFGWPLPVLERVQMWWPWDDPRWATTLPPETGLMVRWAGFVLNPLMAGAAAWLAFVLPFPMVGWLRRRRRASRGLCVRCAHPLLDAARCPECGRPAATAQA